MREMDANASGISVSKNLFFHYVTNRNFFFTSHRVSTHMPSRCFYVLALITVIFMLVVCLSSLLN